MMAAHNLLQLMHSFFVPINRLRQYGYPRLRRAYRLVEIASKKYVIKIAPVYLFHLRYYVEIT